MTNIEVNIETENKKQFSWKRIGKIIGIVVLAGAVCAGVYFFVTWRPIKIALVSVLLDNREHYLSCYELPFYPKVEKVFEQNQATVQQLKDAGAFLVEVEHVNCKGWDQGVEFKKGDIIIQYEAHSQRVAIEKLLGNSFFGIPWRGENH